MLAPFARPLRPATLAALLLAALACASCSPAAWIAGGGLAILPATRLNHLYNHTYAPGSNVVAVTETPVPVRLSTVECDEHGWFRDPTQARAILDSLQAMARTRNTAVVLYVHGWRHDASRKDSDLRAFRSTLHYLGEALQRDTLQQIRRQMTGDPAAAVYGIYVGWRGKAWPEIPVTAINAINYPIYFTFWTRKAAAGRVGRGDLASFVRELDALQRATNAHDNKVMSLVLIGHSFGGHALFDATREALERSLAASITGAASPQDGGTGQRLHHALTAPPDSCRRLVRGLGDLVVLINPAIEAASYRRIDQLVRGTKFRPDQTPVLAVVSAENDAARNTLFTLGRYVSHFGVAVQSDEQARMLGHALGSWPPQVTHRLRLAHDSPENRRRAAQLLLDLEPAGLPESGAGRREATRKVVQQMKRGVPGPPAETGFLTLEASPTRDRRGALLPLPATPPAVVVRTDRTVINNHSDFFRVEFTRWLIDFVLDTQRYRIEQAIKAGPGSVNE